MEELYWMCARFAQHKEALALASLRRNGYEAYYPKLRERRLRKGRCITLTPPLFYGYAFVVIAEGRWYSARWPPGVCTVIMDGISPAKVPARVIDDLRAREENGLITLPEAPRFRAGDAVRITTGAFAGHRRPRRRHEAARKG
jgi:transcription antitermination factor NusG